MRTKTRVDVRFLACVMLIAATVAIGTKFLHDYQIHANAAQLLERADAAEQSGNRDEAAKLLNQYLALKFGSQKSFTEEEEQQHVELLVRLGKLADPGKDPNKTAQLFRAFRTFEEVLRRDGSRRDIRRRTAEIAIVFARYRDALDHLGVLLEGADSSATERVELLKMKGQCHLALEEFVKSQLSYLDALALNQSDPDSYVDLASIWAEFPGRAIDGPEIESLKGSQFDFVRQALPGGSRSPVHCALELLGIMRLKAKPFAIAELRRAEFLFNLGVKSESLPMLPKNAAEAADALIRSLDQDGDRALTGDEIRHKSLPLLADRDESGRIDRDELIGCFQHGSHRIRFESAVASALAAWESLNTDPNQGTPNDRADILVCLTAANLQLADSTQFQSTGFEQVLQYRKAARSFADLGQKLPLVDARFYVTGAELELSEAASVESKQLKLERLQACARLIRNGLGRTAKAPEDTAVAKSDDEEYRDRVQQAAVLKLQWMLVDVLYTIVGLQDGQASADALTAARTETKNLEKLEPSKPLLELVKGQDLMAARDYVAARNHLEDLRNTVEQRSELWRRVTHLLAESQARLENVDAVLDLFGVAAQVDSAMPAVLQWELGQAAALAELGKTDEALQAYVRILNRAQMPMARVQLIELQLVHLSRLPARRRDWGLLQKGREQNQVTILPLPEKAGEHWELPDDPRLTILMQHYAYLRAVTQQQLFEMTADPTNQSEASRYLQLAEVVLSKALEKFPSDHRIPAAQIVLAARRFDAGLPERIARTQRLISRSLEDNGDRLELRLAAVQAASMFPSDAAVEMLKDAAQELGKFNTDEQSQLLQAVARGFATIGNLPLAIEAWEQAANVQPREIRPRLAILELMLAEAERAKSADTLESDRWKLNYERLNELEGGAAKGPFSSVFAARKQVFISMRLHEQNPDADKLKVDLRQVTSLLESARKARPYWPTIPRTLGGIAAVSGNTELAVRHFEDAIARGDRSEPVIGAVLEFYHKQSQSLDAEERSLAQEKLTSLLELIKTQESSLLTGDVGRIADQILWSRSQVAEAIGINQKLSTPTADDKIRLANYELAEIKLVGRGSNPQAAVGAASPNQKEKLDKAETLLREAVEMSPEFPKAWISLTEFYALAGNISRAEETIESARQKLPNTPPHLRPLTLAWCAEALSASSAIQPDKRRELRDLAKQNYEAALEANPDDPGLQYLAAAFFARDSNPQQSIRLLNRVLSPGNSIPEAARAQATIAKAATLARTGQRKDLDQGIELLQSTRFPGKGWQARSLRTLRRLLVQRSTKDDGRLILTALKTLASVDQLTVDEGIELARLHNAYGEWTSARSQYENILEKYPGDGAVLAMYIQALIRRTEDPEALKEARILYEQLERDQPNFFRTKATKCRLVAAEGKRDEAVNELASFVKDHLVDSPKSGVIDDVDAEQYKAVVEDLTLVARSSGDFATLDLLASADQLAQNGSIQEAVKQLAKIGQAQKVVAELRIESLRQAAELSEELGAPKQAIELLQVYVAKSARPAAVLVLAQCLGRNGRAQEAIELCETNWSRLDISQVAATEIALLRVANRTGDEAERVASRLSEASLAAAAPEMKVTLLLLLGDVRDLQGRYDDAVSAFEQVLQLAPSHVVAKNNLAYLLANRNESSRAIQLIDEVITAAGPASELLDTKGVVLMLSGQPEMAVRAFGQAAERQDSSLIRLHTAEAYRVWGKPMLSKVELEKALSLGLEPSRLHPFDRAMFDRLQVELHVAEGR